MTAVEAYFQGFVKRGEVGAIYVSDTHGRIIVDSTAAASNNNDHGYDGAGGEPNPNDASTKLTGIDFTSNVTLSGGQVVRQLQTLKVGQVNSICVQYKEYVVVQFLDGVALVTLVGRRSDHQCAGALLALATTMKTNPDFRDMSAAIQKGEE